jgi:4-alpha-glucanotransferase
MKTVQFIMAIHNHQPVGNFEHVFQKACDMAYHPFLDVFDDFPELRMVLHFSGPLLEWVAKNEPRLASRIKEGVWQNRFEILGGGIGEPIFTMLPDRDLIGQIKTLQRHIQKQYDAKTRGIWLTERVWESALVSATVDAGVDYTVVDDFHFLATGLRDEDLTGYYTVEDRGRILRVFSGSEYLRYAIPFGEPEDTINYLRKFATEDGENVVVYADDGEKFGLWPETYKHVYTKGWLRRWAELLDANKDWIKFTTFADVADSLPPKGRIYLPDASYREMTEWAQLVKAQHEMVDVLERLENSELAKDCRPFMRGSSWRNFKVKYTEAMHMYSRMLEVSNLLAERDGAKHANEARRELYRGQCNCAYWHGVFAGLYMPFLRAAVYEHLLTAERLVARARPRPTRTVADFDLDTRPEVKLSNAHLSAYIKPDRGGSLYELDHHEKAINVTSVMTRREEVYHKRLRDAVAKMASAGDEHAEADGAASIHDQVRWKEPGLEKRLFCDDTPRECFIDRFYPVGTTPDALRQRRIEDWGDFAGQPYALRSPRGSSARIILERTGCVGTDGHSVPVSLQKRITLKTDAKLEVRYVLQYPEGAPQNTIFAVEMNLALSAADAPDRNFFSHNGENLNNLTTTLSRYNELSLGMVDEYLGLEIWLHADPVAGFWTYPVETVNDSEEGFERIHQGSAVLPYWRLQGAPGEEQVCTLTVEARTR